MAHPSTLTAMLIHHLTTDAGKVGIESVGFQEMDGTQGDISRIGKSSLSNSIALCEAYTVKPYTWRLTVDMTKEVAMAHQIDQDLSEDYAKVFTDVTDPMLFLVQHEVLNAYRDTFTWTPHARPPVDQHAMDRYFQRE